MTEAIMESQTGRPREMNVQRCQHIHNERVYIFTVIPRREQKFSIAEETAETLLANGIIPLSTNFSYAMQNQPRLWLLILGTSFAPGDDHAAL